MKNWRAGFSLSVVVAVLGCNDAYPTPVGFDDLDAAIDVRDLDASASEGPEGEPSGGASGAGSGTAGRPSGQAGRAAGPFGGAGTGGAAGSGAPAPASPFTCPGCSGLCLLGICFGAPADPGGGDDSVAGTGADDSDDDADEECGDDTDCEDDDGCCPDDCDANGDSDCSPMCGNDAVEDGETCDPPGSCASSCDDSQVCTTDVTLGSADDCDLACTYSAIDACGASEGCCPDGCGPTTDVDCPGCGNGSVEVGLGETCDPPGSCTCSDDDVCTKEVTTGSADSCTLVCTHPVITECTGDDGCCAEDCGPTTDSDCPGCGNGRIELDLGETCDPPGTCTCEDDDPCTSDVRGGTPSDCDVTCAHVPKTECSGTSDNCCPAGCTFDDDTDCEP
jgi:hypothetical protein